MRTIIISSFAIYAVILVAAWFFSREIKIRRMTYLPDDWDFERNKEYEQDFIYSFEAPRENHLPT